MPRLFRSCCFSSSSYSSCSSFSCSSLPLHTFGFPTSSQSGSLRHLLSLSTLVPLESRLSLVLTPRFLNRSVRGSAPGSAAGSAPGSAPWSAPGSAPGSASSSSATPSSCREARYFQRRKINWFRSPCVHSRCPLQIGVRSRSAPPPPQRVWRGFRGSKTGPGLDWGCDPVGSHFLFV